MVPVLSLLTAKVSLNPFFLGLNIMHSLKPHYFLGDEIYAETFGSRTTDRSAPLTPDTLGWMASLTKLATAVSAMQIVEMGLIGLDDDVSEVVPKLKDLKILVGWEDCDDCVDTNVKDDDVFNRGDGGGEVVKPKGQPVFQDVKGKITLR